MKKQICILGSTGSIGTQALDVISQHPDLYEAYALTANDSWEKLAEQARQYNPAAVVIANEAHYEDLKARLADTDVKVYAGHKALCEIVEAEPIDMVLAALVGFAGFEPTIRAIKALPQLHTRAAQDRHRCRCPPSPDMEDGSEDHHRLSLTHEQRLRSHGGQVALRRAR